MESIHGMEILTDDFNCKHRARAKTTTPVGRPSKQQSQLGTPVSSTPTSTSTGEHDDHSGSDAAGRSLRSRAPNYSSTVIEHLPPVSHLTFDSNPSSPSSSTTNSTVA